VHTSRLGTEYSVLELCYPCAHTRAAMSQSPVPMALEDDNAFHAAVVLMAGLRTPQPSAGGIPTQPPVHGQGASVEAGGSVAQRGAGHQPARDTRERRCERPSCSGRINGQRHRYWTHDQRRYSVCNSCERALRRGDAWNAGHRGVGPPTRACERVRVLTRDDALANCCAGEHDDAYDASLHADMQVTTPSPSPALAPDPLHVADAADDDQPMAEPPLWDLHAPTPVTAAYAEQALRLYSSCNPEHQRYGAAWEGVRQRYFPLGHRGMAQMDLLKTLPGQVSVAEAYRISLVSLLVPYLESLRALLCRGQGNYQQLRVASLKMVRSQPGCGEQWPHGDIGELDEAIHRRAVLLYCSNTLTAAVPNERLPYHRMMAAWRSPAQALRWITDDAFSSHEVQQGGILSFPCEIIHKGIENTGDRDRVFVYALFAPTDDECQECTQFYPRGAPPDHPPPRPPPPDAVPAGPSSSAALVAATPLSAAAARATGLGTQGKSQSAPTKAALMLVRDQLASTPQYSPGSATRAVAQAALMCPKTLRTITRRTHTVDGGSVPEPDTSQRGSGNPSHPLHGSGAAPPAALAVLLRELTMPLDKVDTDKVQTFNSCRRLLELLRAELDIWPSISTVRRWLMREQYRWRKKKFIGPHSIERHFARMRLFIVQYARALAKQRAGTHVLEYTDESSLWQHHTTSHSWSSDKTPQRNLSPSYPSKHGDRIIILTAMDEDGPLSSYDTLQASNNDLADPQPIAQFAFRWVGEGEEDEDYHKSFTGVLWLQWVENRLLPAFAHHRRGKKMILVLDNASYHRIKPPEAVTPSRMTRVECISYLEHHQQPVPDRATVADLRQQVAEHQAQSPATLLEAILRKHGHEVIWTPPYASDTQPIELFWALIKGLLARTFVGPRTVSRMQAAVDAAMLQVTGEQCQRLIAHVLHWLDAWLAVPAQGGRLAAAYPTMEAMIGAAARGELHTAGLLD
jgi:transposase